jgi:hypothetical protein
MMTVTMTINEKTIPARIAVAMILYVGRFIHHFWGSILVPQSEFV